MAAGAQLGSQLGVRITCPTQRLGQAARGPAAAAATSGRDATLCRASLPGRSGRSGEEGDFSLHARDEGSRGSQPPAGVRAVAGALMAAGECSSRAWIRRLLCLAVPSPHGATPLTSERPSLACHSGHALIVRAQQRGDRRAGGGEGRGGARPQSPETIR